MRRRLLATWILGSILTLLFAYGCQPVQSSPSSTSTPTASVAEAASSGAVATDIKKLPQVTVTDDTPVARVDDRVITGSEFRMAWLHAMRPQDYDAAPSTTFPQADAVYDKLVAEAVLVLDARERGVLTSDDSLREPIARQRRKLLTEKLLQEVIPPRITVSAAEIEAAMAKNDKLDQAQAQASVYRQKGMQEVKPYHAELAAQRHLTKNRRVFPRVAQIHRRLLTQPQSPRTQSWILNAQIRGDKAKNIEPELTSEEGALVMATYDGGEFTVFDWFMAIALVSPPGRPRDLSTPKGVESFLDRAIMMQQSLYVAEALDRGLDKDPSFVKSMRSFEDMRLKSAVESSFRQRVSQPDPNEVEAYYETIKDRFMQNNSMTAKTVWCADRATAEKVLQAGQDGQAFDTLIETYSLDPTQVKANYLSAGSEGPFWPTLWAAEPNDVVGPVLGFYVNRRQRELALKWRIVQIETKTPGNPQSLTDDHKNTLSWMMQTERVEAEKIKVGKELLDKYAHTLSPELLSRFDPRDV
ncbi:peptidylprolyl isomerase, partial [Planctomycetota bacterium]